MKVSIIMPSLNVVDYINESIQSALNQTLSDSEIICVDAGSTDGTREIIEEYARIDSRIRIIDSDRKSYGYQMNLGIDAARGEYIGIVETDDYIMPKMMETLYENAKKEDVDYIKSINADFYTHKNKVISLQRSETKLLKEMGKVLDKASEITQCLSEQIHIGAGIYKRSFLIEKGIRFNETMGASFQDTSFLILVILTARRCIYTKDCFYYYRTDREESSVKSDSKIGCIVDEFKYIDKYIMENNVDISEVENELVRKQIELYLWNARRLSDSSRNTFLKIINEDMMDIKRRYRETFDDKHQLYLDQLLDINKIIEEEEKERTKRDNFLAIIKDVVGTKAIMVSAGRYFDKLNQIQQFTNKHFIEAVCDNNKNLWNKEVNGYTIQPVDYAITKYPDMKWLIANRKHSDEIKRQLLDGGINEDDIVVVDYIPEVLEILDELMSNEK